MSYILKIKYKQQAFDVGRCCPTCPIRPAPSVYQPDLNH